MVNTHKFGLCLEVKKKVLKSTVGGVTDNIKMIKKSFSLVVENN